MENAGTVGNVNKAWKVSQALATGGPLPTGFVAMLIVKFAVFALSEAGYNPNIPTAMDVLNFFFPPEPSVYNVRINGICQENNEVWVLYSQSGVSSNAARSFQWWRNGYPIPRATASTYRLTQADAGTTIFVVVCLEDSWGTYKGESPSVFIQNVNDLPTGTVTITGTAAQNQVLTALSTIKDKDGMGPITYTWVRTATYLNSAYVGEIKITGTPRRDQVLTASSTVVDPDGMGPINYQWNRDGVQIVTGTSYTLGEADVGRYITVTASYTNRVGIVEYATSKATPMVKNFVEITGINRVYETLTATNTLTGVLGPITYTWLRNGVQIATGASYVLSWADEGTYITVSASYSKSVGIIESITTLPITRVQSTLYIEGTLVQGQVLTVIDLRAYNNTTYAWKRNGVTIATGTSYTLVGADVGTYITVESTSVNYGNSIKNTSVAIDVIAAMPLVEEVIGEKMKSGPDMWYKLEQNDVGRYISLIATYTDAFGTVETVRSVSTLQVTNVNDSPTGTLTIIGTPAQYQVLTVTNTINDLDGIESGTYQWNRNGTAIPDANSDNYALTLDDVGYNISVTASYTDLQGNPESVTSAATIAVVHVNTLPTGDVTIAGLPAQYEVLTVSNTLADVDQLGPISYQWNLNGLPKSGATGTTYTLTQADVGVVFTVTASYTDLQGITESVTSAATTPVANVPDAVTGGVYIVGNAYQSQVLTAITTGLNVNQPGLSDVDGLGAFSYQWKRSNGNNFDNILLNATGRTYTLTEDDVGRGLKVTVSYTDGYEHFESVTSPVTALVVNINDSPSGAVTISGNPEESQVLTVTNDLDDIDGMGLVSYQWKRNGYPISGATGSTYELTKYEIGKRITVSAHYTDGHGSDEYITSDATAPVANKNDLLTGDVGISGPPVQYKAIFADTTGLSDGDGMGSFTYQWNRNGIALYGANGSSYWLGQDDVDQYITVTVYHRDLQGTVETKTSVVGVIPSNINDLPTGKVTINGLAKQNEWLTVTHNLNDLDGMVGGSASAITYQWKTVDYNGTNDIEGATGTSYKLTQGEVGKCIIVTAFYTDSHGTHESKTSAQTDWVIDVIDSPTGGVTINGTPAQYQVLTATVAATPTSPALNDIDGINGLYYEWQRNGIHISGTINTPTYTLTGLDVGTRITATATYQDNQGREKTVTSPATPTITVGNAPSWVVTLNGIPRINEALFSDVSTIVDLVSYRMVLTPNVYLSKISYQWQRNRMDIPGEVKPYYVLVATDTGYKFSVKITLEDESGAVYSITSVESAVISVTAASYPGFNGAYISGTTMKGCTLTASHNMYDDIGDIFAPVTGAVTYEWYRNGGNGGTPDAIGSTYELTQSDIGIRIGLRARSALYGGSALYRDSLDTAVIINSIDAAPGTVTILGTPTYGNTLSIFHTMYAIDATGWMESVQWKRNGSDINLATGSTYVLTKADVGAVITVTMKWTNLSSSQYVTSAATASVANANALPSGDITIDGTREKNKLLTANISTLGDLDGMGTLGYQWKSCANIAGAIPTNIATATSSTYTTNVGDEGKLISVTVSYTDLTNVQESKTSRPILIARANNLPSGSVIITKTVDGLIASHNLGDVDGMGTVSYQWKRGGYPILGATGSSYTLIPSDTGSTITVTASYTDGFGVNESITSDATAPIPYVNTLVTGVVTVSGLLEQDKTLTANATGLVDIDGKGTLHYQWIRGTENIPGATSSTYKLTQAEVGKKISVKVYYTDLHGYAESKTVAVGAAGATVANAPDAPTGEVTITGTIIQGSTLTASHSLDDLDGMGTVTYYWKRDGTQIATGTTYTLLEADVDKIITVTASYTDGYLKQESVISTATVRVVNVNDPLVGRVAISGTASQGVTLYADTTGMNDDDGRDIVAYIWMRDGIEISGATGSSYPLVQADVGKQITLTMSYIDLHNTYESSTSLPTAPVGNANDSPSGVLSIAGTAKQGLVLTATLTGLSDVDGLGQLSYQWMRNGVDINLATNTTYKLVEADVGKVISVKVSYTDGFYYAESILCNAATSSVINTNDSPTGTVTIHGFPAEYQTLTVTSALGDLDGLGAITYHWKRNGVHIASGTSYPLTWADVGSKMTVTAVYTDLRGTWESVGITSDPTDTIVHVNTPVTGEVTISISRTSPVTGEVTTTSGTPKENDLLTAITSGLSDVDGLGSFSYQWKSDGVNILDATDSTYTLTQAMVGKTISVTVSYTDLHGNAWDIESKTSAATAPVININDLPFGEVTISGILQTGQLLTASNYLKDLDGLGEISYQWKRGATVIATGSTYTLTLDDVGQYITVVASYTDLQLNPESASVTTNDVITTADNPVTGDITIHGLAKQRETLTYSSTLQDIDGIDSIEYIWIGPNDKELGRNTSYTLTQSDVGSTIKLYAVCKDMQGRTTLKQSDQTDIVENALDSPSGKVKIDGTPTQNQLLTANTNEISDLDGLTYIFTYQWASGGVDVPGAIGATYTLLEADVGKQITVTVKYTDGFGAHETVTSDPTPAVANWNDPPYGKVTIAGLAKQGELLTASNTLGDVDGMGEIITYTWIRGDTQIIATGSTYELTQADVGYAIKVVASYTDGHETRESVTSDATDLVANVNDLPYGAPRIDGTRRQRETLTAYINEIGDVDGLGAFTYEWWRRTTTTNDGSSTMVQSGPSNTYILKQSDVGKYMQVVVKYNDGSSTWESISSNVSLETMVTDVNDDPTGWITIGGLPKQKETLTVSYELTDMDGLGAIGLQWKRDGSDIEGATGTTYILREADVNKRITVTASYIDLPGTHESITSAATTLIENWNDPLVGHVMIGGDLTHGQTLTASHTLTDADGLQEVSYQWLKNGSIINGAVGSTYLLIPADIGAKISVTASYTDGHETRESKTSPETYQIQPIRTGYSLQTKNIESVPPTPPVNGKIIIANTSEIAITTSDNAAALSAMTSVEKQSLVKHNVSALLAKYAPSSGSDKLYVSKSLLPFAVTSTATDTVELIDAKSSSVASPLVRVGDASAGAVYIDTVPGNSVMLTYSPDTVAITQTSDTAFTVAINGAAAVNKLVGDKILLKSVVLTLGSITAAPNNLPVFVKNAPTTAYEKTSYSYTVSVSDADNDTFTVTAPILPSWLTFSAGTLSCPSVPTAVIGSHAVQLLAEDIWNGKTYYDFTITVQNVPATGTITSSGFLKYSDLNTAQTSILKGIHVSESDASIVINTASVNGVDVKSYLQLDSGPSDYIVKVKSGQHAALLTLLRSNPGNVSIAIKITDVSTPTSPIYVNDTITVLNDSLTTTQQFPSSMTIIEDSSTAYAQSGGTDSVITFSDPCLVVLNGTYKDYFTLVAADGTNCTYKLKCKDLASARAIIPGTSYSLTVTATSIASALTITSPPLSVQVTNLLTTAIVGGAKILTRVSLQTYISSSVAIPNIATITLSESDPQSVTLQTVTVNGSSVDNTYFTLSGSAGSYVLSVNTSTASQLLTRLNLLTSSSGAYNMLMTFQVVEQGGNTFTQTITATAANDIIKISLKPTVTNVPSMVSYSVNGSVATVVMNYYATPAIDYADYIISDANSAVGTRVVGGDIAYDGATLPTMYVGVSLVRSMVYQSPGEWIVTYYESYSGVTGSQSNTLTLKFSVRGAINFVLPALNASYELLQALSITGNYDAPAPFALPTITLSMPASQFNDGLFQLALTDSNINTLVNPATEAVYFSEKITYYADQAKFPLLKNSGNVLLKDLPVVNGAALKPLRQRNAGTDRLSDSMVHELAYQAIGVSLMNDQLANGAALTSSIDTYLTTALPAFVRAQLAACDGKTQNIAGASDLTTRANVSRELFMQIVESVVGGVDPVTGNAKSSRLKSLFDGSNFVGGKYGIKFIAGDTLRFSITIAPYSVGGVVQNVDYIVDGVQHAKQEARTVELVISMV